MRLLCSTALERLPCCLVSGSEWSHVWRISNAQCLDRVCVGRRWKFRQRFSVFRCFRSFACSALSLLQYCCNAVSTVLTVQFCFLQHLLVVLHSAWPLSGALCNTVAGGPVCMDVMGASWCNPTRRQYGCLNKERIYGG